MTDEFESVVEQYVKDVRFHGKNINNVIFKGNHIISESQKKKILDVHEKYECNKEISHKMSHCIKFCLLVLILLGAMIFGYYFVESKPSSLELRVVDKSYSIAFIVIYYPFLCLISSILLDIPRSSLEYDYSTFNHILGQILSENVLFDIVDVGSDENNQPTYDVHVHSKSQQFHDIISIGGDNIV